MALSERQTTILKTVARQYIKTGQPVSSKAVAKTAGLSVSPSTIRNEYAVMEEMGYLTHPHTSAGRVPTGLGYREFVDSLLSGLTAHEPGHTDGVVLPEMAKEVDVALQQTSEAMFQATKLLALVIAPQVSGTPIRHVELLLLQPNLVMVVFIFSTGRVTKRIIGFPEPVDTGMVQWARTYLNETVGEHILTGRLVRGVLENRDLTPRERDFLQELDPAFFDLLNEQLSDTLYVGGTSQLLSDSYFQDVAEVRDLLKLLERRYVLLGALRSLLGSGKLVISIGDENPEAALRKFSVVAASYGLPHRQLGAVSLLGPVRMDYEKAISTVRSSASLLSDFLEDRYE